MTKYNMQLDVKHSLVALTIGEVRVTMSINELDSDTRPNLQMMEVSYHPRSTNGERTLPNRRAEEKDTNNNIRH